MALRWLTNDGFCHLVPRSRVVPQPMSCPLPTGGVGGARDDDAPLLRDPPQRTGGQQVILSAHLKGVLGRKR